MAYASKPIGGDKEVFFWTDIHKSACAVASQQYRDAFGVDHRDDPLCVDGNERHHFWLTAYDQRMLSLVENPNQD